MSDLEMLFDSAPEDDMDVEAVKKKGPTNRINDLDYSTWMKYQKSFFRWTNVKTYVESSILFFSKEFPRGLEASQILIFGFSEYEPTENLGARKIIKVPAVTTHDATHGMKGEINDSSLDHAILDLRTLEISLNKSSEIFLVDLFNILNIKMRNFAYFQLLLPENSPSEYPISWQISRLGGGVLRLRDERIAILENGNCAYSLIFQRDDELLKKELSFVPIAIATKDEQIFPGWTIPKPPPRNKNEILHPAKYPETLIELFVSAFSSQGDLVFDPMSGTGSSQLAALKLERKAFGFELMPEFAKIANERIKSAYSGSLFDDVVVDEDLVISADAIAEESYKLKPSNFDYVVTSPPYWSMLRNAGSENQKNRRDKSLKTHYSEDERDLGNIEDYDRFIDILVEMYELIGRNMNRNAYITIVVKNIKRNHTVYPLAWDLVLKLAGEDGGFEYVGNTFWCQDDIGMKPFAVGTHWVSNTVHQYCIHLKKK
jgi:DNA modification methylase